MLSRDVFEKFLVAFSFCGEQRDFVRSVVEAVEHQLGRGTVFFDEWFEHVLGGWDADLKLQKIYGEQCELAVVCLSKQYVSKPWTKAEHRAVRARMMKLEGSQIKGDEYRMLPIRVGEGELETIPFNTIAPDVRSRTAEAVADLIISRLLLIRPDVKIIEGSSPDKSSWPGTPPALLNWPMADHSGARDSFGHLLTWDAPWRLLLIRGSSETGKSHITKQMLANALQVTDLACGRFDFKGTTDMDAELRVFVQGLFVPLPPATATLNDRLAQILDGLKTRARPTLLVFDTYETAGETEDWAERQLLPTLVRANWLRVVIAGQRVPSSAGAMWDSAPKKVIDLVPPLPEDWLAFGQTHKPGITLDFVRQAHQYCGGKSSVMAQLVGPSA